METPAQDQGPRGCHHRVSPSAAVAHLRSRETRVPRLPLEALEGEKSWVGVPRLLRADRGRRRRPQSLLGTPSCSGGLGGMPTHPLGSASPGPCGGTVLAQGTPGSNCRDMPGTEHRRGVTRKAVTHRRTHHPWWPRWSGVTLERKRDGLGVSWGGGLPPCQHPGMPQSLTRSPGLPSLPSSPSKPAGPCGDKVRVSEGGLDRGALGVPEGPALGTPGHGNGDRVPGEWVQPAVLPSSTMIPVVLPLLPTKVA